TSSSAEMASKAGTGIDLDLDSVPQRDEGMTAYELMLSESQERMLLVAEEGREQEIIDIFLKHGLTAAVIGKITDTKRLRVSQSGAVVADVPVAFLVDNAPVYDRRAKAPAYYSEFQEQGEEIPEIEDLKATFLELLAQPTISSKAVLYEQFKGGENVVRGPGSNAGVIAVEGTNKGLALTVDCNSRYIYLDPYMGGAIAVAEAARNIICSGGKPLAVTDGLNFGNPYNEEIFWQMEQSVLGISEACRRLGTPVVGGNVSLFNETGGRAIYPTPIIGMVGIVEDLSLVTAKDFQNPGDLIYLLGETLPEFGGSELQKLHFGRIFGRPPRLDLKREKELQKQVKEAIKARLVQSAHDVSTGGLGIALAECLMDKKLGAAVNLANDPVTELFSESQSRFILTVKPSKQAEFEAIAKDAVLIGEVKAARELTFTAGDKLILALDGEEMAEVWKGALPCLLQTKS
ncbi:MAG TPA: phosphoribosylformylglycinamidine synthase II, partial [Firmicutes bacterium]|nr:phosphoribosylformylglycinamidine synthase II [Bacillota bacterium]